jgi:hypothetical protein
LILDPLNIFASGVEKVQFLDQSIVLQVQDLTEIFETEEIHKLLLDDVEIPPYLKTFKVVAFIELL